MNINLFDKIDYKVNLDNVYAGYGIEYMLLKEDYPEIFFKGRNFNKPFFKYLTNKRTVFNLKLLGKRGTDKSKFMRNLFIILDTLNDNFTFTSDNIVFTDKSLFQLCSNIHKNKEVNKKYYVIRDETPKKHGIGAETESEINNQYIESMRIDNINLGLISPSLKESFDDIEYDYLLTPYAYDNKRKIFFCLLKLYGNDTYKGNITIYDKDEINGTFYLEYKKAKENYVDMSSKSLNEGNNFFMELKYLNEQYNIFENKFRTDKEDKDILITFKEFKTFLVSSGLNLSINQYDLVYVNYKWIKENNENRKKFNQFCIENS